MFKLQARYTTQVLRTKVWTLTVQFPNTRAQMQRKPLSIDVTRIPLELMVELDDEKFPQLNEITFT